MGAGTSRRLLAERYAGCRGPGAEVREHQLTDRSCVQARQIERFDFGIGYRYDFGGVDTN